MKLLLCKECHDIFNLKVGEIKQCSCGKVKGMYTDNLNAWHVGGVPLCIANGSLREAMSTQVDMDHNEPDEFYGTGFHAWVCPRNSTTFKKRRNHND